MPAPGPGHGSDAPDTPSFSIITVDDNEGADLTLVGVDFTNGGGESNYHGGHRQSRDRHGPAVGTFRDNRNDDYGGGM